MKSFRSVAVLAVLAAALVVLASPVAAEIRGTLRETGKGYAKCDETVEQWSGYFDIPGKTDEKHYFYWGFAPRHPSNAAPIILWLTGGPGCSSSIALLVENGPCLMNESSGEIYRNEYGWNNDAYIFYLDQPAGVGFSYANDEDYDGNEQEVSDDVYNFLQRLFEAHPEWRANPLFVVGESYGGHYAPATAYRIFQGNTDGSEPYLNLMGLAVGNGLTEPYSQYPQYPTLAYDWCIEKKGEPCVSYVEYLAMQAFVPMCQEFIAACNSGDDEVADSFCEAASYTCNPMVAIYTNTGLNPYNIRLQCDGDLCYPMNETTKFMNREDVQAELGVGPMEWQECNMDVYQKFSADWFKTFNYTIPSLIENGIRVMIYAGDLDFICNWIGNKIWSTELEWEKTAEFQAAPDVPFYYNGAEVGLIRSVSALWSPIQYSFVQVYEAGHMVPMDQPGVSLDMINNFIFNREFNTTA